ncbi:hypothetical protein L3X38_036832 [Prunus dulcis]|uniref:RNase H type-1 domain-containing protein n=1 Tax=Prunus dulcis TaxID=3755 RepID=A0AAD4YQ21_PRUDU|nr:hypothetical protein L3X38_036832 [Prunus dulcis]
MRGGEELIDKGAKEKREESVTDNLGKLNTACMFETLQLGSEYRTAVAFLVKDIYSQEKSVQNRCEEKSYHPLLLEYKYVFAWTYKEMSSFNPKVVVHHITVKPGMHPIKQTQHRFPPEFLCHIEAKANKLIAFKFIREVKYPTWIVNIVPVKKKITGQICICVDFRDLNEACLKDDFPLPIIELMVDRTTGHEVGKEFIVIRSARIDGASAGVIFVSRKRHILPYSFFLSELCSNNVAEYQALIMGLQMTMEMKISSLEVFDDSRYRLEIRRRAPRFIYYKEILYRRSFEGVFLRCLGEEDASKAMEEAHSGICVRAKATFPNKEDGLLLTNGQGLHGLCEDMPGMSIPCQLYTPVATSAASHSYFLAI